MKEYSLECLAMYNFKICYFNVSSPTIKALSHILYICLKQRQNTFTKGTMHLIHKNKKGKGRNRSPSRTDLWRYYWISEYLRMRRETCACFTTKNNVGKCLLKASLELSMWQAYRMLQIWRSLMLTTQPSPSVSDLFHSLQQSMRDL